EGGRALEAAERIALVVGVLGDARHRERVEGLEIEGGDAADERRDVVEDEPGSAPRTKEAGIALGLFVLLRDEGIAGQGGADGLVDGALGAELEAGEARVRHASMIREPY